jgi:hypothetical protein
MAQHLPTPAGQAQSAEVLVAVLALVGDAITTSTAFDFAAPAGSTSAANDSCRAYHAILANSSIRYRQQHYWIGTLQMRECEYSSRPCGSCRRGHAHGLSIRAIGSISVTTNHRRASRLVCSYTGLPHLLTPSITALLCILMHVSCANASMCKDACIVETHPKSSSVRGSCVAHRYMLRPPLNITYTQLYDADCADVWESVVVSRNNLVYSSLGPKARAVVCSLQ